MSVVELTLRQKKLLEVLVHLYRQTDDTVKSEKIAAFVDRNPGTVRNQMSELGALQLVESVPGPKGGYRPTDAAYDALGIEAPEAAAAVPLGHNGSPVEDASVLEIDLVSVHHPENCLAEVRLQGSTIPYHTGDTVTVGPTPAAKLVVEGTVVGQDDSANSIVVAVEEMRAPADG